MSPAKTAELIAPVKSLTFWRYTNQIITGSIARSANLPVFRLLRGRF